jgi:four helix bundle protein
MPVKQAFTTETQSTQRGHREKISYRQLQFAINIAKGSAGEVRSLLRVALEIGYLDQTRHDKLREAVITISKSLSNQIRAIKTSIN